jgi:hypothetical protein
MHASARGVGRWEDELREVQRKVKGRRIRRRAGAAIVESQLCSGSNAVVRGAAGARASERELAWRAAGCPTYPPETFLPRSVPAT